MARSLNKVILIGYAADEPVVKTFDNGGKVANLTVVTNEFVRHQDGTSEEIPEWNRIVFWNNTANVVDTYVHKGMRLYVEGKLRTRSYTDKNGVKRYTTEIYADNMIMLDSRNGDGAAPREAYRPPYDNQGANPTGSFTPNGWGNQGGGYGNQANNYGAQRRGYGNQYGNPGGGYGNQGGNPGGTYGNPGGAYGGANLNPQFNFGGNPGAYGNQPAYPSQSASQPNSFAGQGGAYQKTSWDNQAPGASATPFDVPAVQPAVPAAPAAASQPAPSYPQFDNSPYGGLGGTATATTAPGSFGAATTGAYSNASVNMDSTPAAGDDSAAAGSPAPAAAPAAPAVTPTAAPVTDNSNDDDIPF